MSLKVSIFINLPANNLGNYKGLMLCSRPNEEIRIQVEKPFISRVDPKVPSGWNPVKAREVNKPLQSTLIL